MAFADSNTFTIEPVASLALAQLCQGLAVGATTTYAAATGHGLSEAQLEWQSVFFHDDDRDELVVFGKAANNDTDWRMRRMSLVTEAWSSHDVSPLNRSAHIYGAFGLDFATGDAYATPGQNATDGDRDLWKYTRATNSWAQHRTDLYIAAHARPSNGCVVHPNLYGSGVSGVIDADRTQIIGIYRPSTDSVQRITPSFSLGTAGSGIGVYWPARNEVIIGSVTHARISPNGGSTPIVAQAGTPPIATRGTTSGSVPNFGAMVVHPGNPNKLMILRRGGNFAYWTSTDATTWTEVGTHPFTGVIQNAQLICSLGGGMGCLLGLFANGSTNTAVLWRPPT